MKGEEFPPLYAHCTQYQKHYGNDAEELERYGLFKKSTARAAKQDALNPEPVFGITSMSDRHTQKSQETLHNERIITVREEPSLHVRMFKKSGWNREERSH